MIPTCLFVYEFIVNDQTRLPEQSNKIKTNKKFFFFFNTLHACRYLFIAIIVPTFYRNNFKKTEFTLRRIMYKYISRYIFKYFLIIFSLYLYIHIFIYNTNTFQLSQ